jgi:hypothetical protein
VDRFALDFDYLPQAPPATEAPAPPNTDEPDLKDLNTQQLVALDQAREDLITSCLADIGETDEERCILIWICAVNQVGRAACVPRTARNRGHKRSPPEIRSRTMPCSAAPCQRMGSPVVPTPASTTRRAWPGLACGATEQTRYFVNLAGGIFEPSDKPGPALIAIDIDTPGTPLP